MPVVHFDLKKKLIVTCIRQAYFTVLYLRKIINLQFLSFYSLFILIFQVKLSIFIRSYFLSPVHKKVRAFIFMFSCLFHIGLFRLLI